VARPKAPDPAIGVWKLNFAKSIFKLTPAPQSYVLKCESWNDGLKASADIVDDQGTRRRPEVAYKLDGNDYPVKGSPLADTISVRQIHERGTDITWKKDGKVVFISRNVVSPDGRTYTVTRTKTDAQGQSMNDVLVLEKQ
jgi:hypothetical protein